MSEQLDLIVIGWGKGGKTLAGAVARAGKRVAMIEASAQMYGGTCINIGCVPTKALIHDAETRTDSGFSPSDFFRAVQRRDGLTAKLRAKNYSMLDELDAVAVYTGTARFTGPHTVQVSAAGETLELEAKTIVINTGAVPAIPDLEGAVVGGRIHDSTSLQHAPLPRRLVVVGGGYVGIEFASMFAHFGSAVTVLDRGATPLRREDPEVAIAVVSALADAGARVINSARVAAVEDGADAARVHYTLNGVEHTIEADAVLLALGRTPAIKDLDLERAGVATTKHGAIEVDGYLRTSAEGIYALGDVNGGPQFTYVSLDDHRIVTDQLLGAGLRNTGDRVAVPYTIFTTPPLGRVGLTEAGAHDAGYRIKIALKQVAEIAAMPRPKIVGDPRGVIKVIVDADTDLILGAALMHVDAQEVINLVALAMRTGMTASALRESIFTHPSSTEALNEVLGTLS